MNTRHQDDDFRSTLGEIAKIHPRLPQKHYDIYEVLDRRILWIPPAQRVHLIELVGSLKLFPTADATVCRLNSGKLAIMGCTPDGRELVRKLTPKLFPAFAKSGSTKPLGNFWTRNHVLLDLMPCEALKKIFLQVPPDEFLGLLENILTQEESKAFQEMHGMANKLPDLVKKPKPTATNASKTPQKEIVPAKKEPTAEVKKSVVQKPAANAPEATTAPKKAGKEPAKSTTKTPSKTAVTTSKPSTSSATTISQQAAPKAASDTKSAQKPAYDPTRVWKPKTPIVPKKP